MPDFDYMQVRNAAVNLTPQGLEVGGRILNAFVPLDCGELGQVSVEQLAQAARYYQEFSEGSCRPQLAALVFDITGDFRALDFYFPITNGLHGNPQARQDFYEAIKYIANHPNLDLVIMGRNRANLNEQAPPAIRHLVAGHIAEVFYYRKDLVDRLLTTPRHFRVYTSRVSFEQDGGIAGGDYRFDHEAIQLELSRLFEGFYGKTPGVAPFLHEFGHMLDHFDAGTGRMGNCEGTLPGMNPADGPLFNPQSRQLFSAGKRLEQERYQRYQDGQAGPNDPVPVGHPYVHQTDGEFIAGTLEMFFRNPNYFAAQNPTLYQAFATLLGQDPRRDWKEDFGFYVTENRKAYLGGQRPSPQHITIPQ